MSLEIKISKSLWIEVVAIAAHLVDYSNVKVFRDLVFGHTNQEKLNIKAMKCVLYCNMP